MCRKWWKSFCSDLEAVPLYILCTFYRSCGHWKISKRNCYWVGVVYRCRKIHVTSPKLDTSRYIYYIWGVTSRSTATRCAKYVFELVRRWARRIFNDTYRDIESEPQSLVKLLNANVTNHEWIGKPLKSLIFLMCATVLLTFLRIVWNIDTSMMDTIHGIYTWTILLNHINVWMH